MRKSKFLVWAGILAIVFTAAPAIASSHDDDDEGDHKFKAHGEVRARGEFVSNFYDFNDDGVDSLGNDDDFGFFPYRVRLGISGQFTDNLYGYVELQNASAWGLHSEQRDVLFSNFDNIDLYMGYIIILERANAGRPFLEL